MTRDNNEMSFYDVNQQLTDIIKINFDENTVKWIDDKLQKIISEKSSKELYLTYSLLSSKLDKDKNLFYPPNDSNLKGYLKRHNANLLEVGRLHVLRSVLEKERDFFSGYVSNIIQIADKEELIAFLKYLILLPNPEHYRSTAVEALRTNIATVFDAIALNNPYPTYYFDEQQWNQMYLKAAFMQRPLENIMDVDARANKDLSRIISDYAHERWAAGREIDPIIWRPVGNFMDEATLKDIERLLGSDNSIENRAGALCCYQSNQPKAQELLNQNKELLTQIRNKKITWETLKN